MEEKPKYPPPPPPRFSTPFLVVLTVCGLLILASAVALIAVAVFGEGQSLTTTPGDPNIGACLLGIAIIVNGVIAMMWFGRNN